MKKVRRSIYVLGEKEAKNIVVTIESGLLSEVQDLVDGGMIVDKIIRGSEIEFETKAQIRFKFKKEQAASPEAVN